MLSYATKRQQQRHICHSLDESCNAISQVILHHTHTPHASTAGASESEKRTQLKKKVETVTHHPSQEQPKDRDLDGPTMPASSHGSFKETLQSLSWQLIKVTHRMAFSNLYRTHSSNKHTRTHTYIYVGMYLNMTYSRISISISIFKSISIYIHVLKQH